MTGSKRLGDRASNLGLTRWYQDRPVSVDNVVMLTAKEMDKLAVSTFCGPYRPANIVVHVFPFSR